MGAVIGGIYACGKLDVYETWARAISKIDIIRLLDLSWGSQRLVEGERIISVLKNLVGDRRIEDLRIGYTAVAADIKREKEIWLKHGSLFDAIRASISLPLFFKPFEMNGTKLLDGGILNPVPIAPTFEDNTDLTIALNLGGSPAGRRQPKPEPELKRTDESAAMGISAKIKSFIEGTGKNATTDNPADWKMLSIADQTFDAMQGAIARQKLAAYPPDKTIMIARDACGTLEFDRADEMIALGYDSAAQSFDKL